VNHARACHRHAGLSHEIEGTLPCYRDGWETSLEVMGADMTEATWLPDNSLKDSYSRSDTFMDSNSTRTIQGTHPTSQRISLKSWGTALRSFKLFGISRTRNSGLKLSSLSAAINLRRERALCNRKHGPGSGCFCFPFHNYGITTLVSKVHVSSANMEPSERNGSRHLPKCLIHDFKCELHGTHRACRNTDRERG